jgi:site-specific DNA-methyltransferase (adenine-specific)
VLVTVPYYRANGISIYCGDSRELLRGKESLVDAVITDPPYEMGFMSKAWDQAGVSFDPNTWQIICQVLKPGGHMLAFGGTRTFHRIACAIEDGGFELRDTLMWLHSQGFPKSQKVSPGQGTALKPAWEPITLARAPLMERTLTENVALWGTGGLNIDATRIPVTDGAVLGRRNTSSNGWKNSSGGDSEAISNPIAAAGRWPANVVATDDVLGELSRFFFCSKASTEERAMNNHPTIKPLALCEWLVQLICRETDIVLDPFMGSGSTLVAAQRLGRRAIGIEISEEYCEIAAERVRHEILV